MDIGDMAYIVRHTQSFRDTMAGTDDHIIMMKREGPDRHGKERQIALIVREGQRQTLNETGPDRMFFDDGRNMPFPMHKRKDVRIREEFTENLKTSFPSTHTYEPVMNEGNPHTLSPSKTLP
jgi:hypothetical protein